LIFAYSKATGPDGTLVAVEDEDDSEVEAGGSCAITFAASTTDGSRMHISNAIPKSE
jgi:hypothetical protein